MQEFKGPWTSMVDGRYARCDFEVENVDFQSLEWCQVSDADGRVAAIIVGTEYHDEGDVDARAALISAAPELLSELIEADKTLCALQANVAHAVNSEPRWDGVWDEIQNRRDAIKSVIDKATKQP
ncbi:hypothetical protein [Alcanivorax sp.]|uniref:hypothetical protein n=1 Tax=Alcanivorax sp. TaxID=1872427 RepID=UPI003BA97C6F